MYIHNQIDIIRQPFNEGKKKKAIQVICNDQAKNFLNGTTMTPFTSADNYYYAQRIAKRFAKESQDFRSNFFRSQENKDITEIKKSIRSSQKNLHTTKDFDEKNQSTDNQRQEQINLDFLKLNTSKNKQVLSIGIRGERIQVKKELPAIVSSQSKEPTRKQSLINRTFNLKKIYRTEPFETERNTFRKNSTDFQYPSLNKSQNALNMQSMKGQIRNEDYSFYNQNPKDFSLHKEQSARDVLTRAPLKSHHSNKPSNLKLNIRYNKNINLETLLEQNNAFYMKYKAPCNQSKRMSLENEPLSPNKSEAELTFKKDQIKANKIILNPFKFQQIKHEIKTFEKSVTNLRNSEYILLDNPSLNSLLILDDGSSRNSQKDTDYLNEKLLKNSIEQNFPTYSLQKISQVQRMGNLPNLILIIHFDGILGFFKTSIFGFSKYLINALSHMDIQNQLNRQFIEIKVNEEDQEAFYINKQIKQVVKNLSRAYIIVFIINQEYFKFFQPLVTQLKEKKIFYDALYSVDYSGGTKYLVTDYQAILIDFNINDPKLVIVAKSIDLEDADELFVNCNFPLKHFKTHYYNQIQSVNSDQFAQNIKILRQAAFNSKNIDLFYGVFPKAGKCSHHNLRTILFGKISFFTLVEIIKTSSHIPTLDKLEQICVAIMNEYSFLNLLYEQKNHFIRCQFTRLFNRYKINNQIKKNQNNSLLKIYRETHQKMEIELESENDIYVQELAELELAEAKKRSNFDLQNKLQKMGKKFRRRRSLYEQSPHELQCNIQTLIEELFTKNRGIYKHILKSRIYSKQQIQNFNQIDQLEQYQKNLNLVDVEIEYCYQYNDLILFCVFQK